MAGRFEKNVSAHFQDVAENAADVAHLDRIHGASLFLTGEDFANGKGDGWKGRWIQHCYETTWSESGNAATLQMELRSKVLGRELKFMATKGYFRITGPSLVQSCFSVGKWRFYTCFTMTPTSLFTVSMVHYMFTEPGFPWILAKVIHHGFSNGVS